MGLAQPPPTIKLLILTRRNFGSMSRVLLLHCWKIQVGTTDVRGIKLSITFDGYVQLQFGDCGEFEVNTVLVVKWNMSWNVWERRRKCWQLLHQTMEFRKRGFWTSSKFRLYSSHTRSRKFLLWLWCCKQEVKWTVFLSISDPLGETLMLS